MRANSSHFSLLEGLMVQQDESISNIRDSMYLISIDDGFAVYNTHAAQQGEAVLPNVLIRRVENTTGKQQLISDKASGTCHLALPYPEYNIRFTVALPYFKQASVQFQYYLEGYSSTWSPWSGADQKEYTNLGPDEYRLFVRARLSSGAVTRNSSFRFRVLPPWYASRWAVLFYVLLAVTLTLLFRWLYHQKLRRDKARIQQVLEEEKQEQLRQEALLNEQKIVSLKNEQLRSELASKSRELANTALNIVHKNELLQNIRLEVEALKDEAGQKLSDQKLRKIQKTIAAGMSSEQDWRIFENSFNEANESYFRRLKETYPELTPNDLKLCALLRMNMSSKEIASLLSVTVRSVELRRYRLRKKLSMDHDKNLMEFILSF